MKWARSDADRAEVAERVASLLGKPLTADDAVQLALLNNRALQAGFHDLGISEAELVRAFRLFYANAPAFRLESQIHEQQDRQG